MQMKKDTIIVKRGGKVIKQKVISPSYLETARYIRVKFFGLKDDTLGRKKPK